MRRTATGDASNDVLRAKGFAWRMGRRRSPGGQAGSQLLWIGKAIARKVLQRLIEKSQHGYHYERRSISKRPCPEWFREQAAEIPIHSSDPEHRQAIIDRYPRPWRVGRPTPHNAQASSP